MPKPYYSSLAAIACGSWFLISGVLASPVVELTVHGDDWACSGRLRASHSVDFALEPWCHPYRQPAGILYHWAGNKFLPVSLPREVRSLSGDARYAVSGPGAMSGADSRVMLHDLETSVETLVALGGFAPLLTADGSAVVYGDTPGYRILRWDRATGVKTLLTNRSPHLMAASSDGLVLALKGSGPGLWGQEIVDLRTGGIETLCEDPYDDSCFLGLSPDGRWVLYRATRADGSRERRLRDRNSDEEWFIPGVDIHSSLRAVFDQGSQRMLFSRPWPGCTDALFVRDLLTQVESPVVVEGPCPARGYPSAFGPGTLVAFSGNYVTHADVVFADGAEPDPGHIPDLVGAR